MTKKALDDIRIVKSVLRKYREDSNMTDKEWYKLCARYSGRDVTTVVRCLSRLYGELPANADKLICEEMEKEVKKYAAYIEFRNREIG